MAIKSNALLQLKLMYYCTLWILVLLQLKMIHMLISPSMILKSAKKHNHYNYGGSLPSSPNSVNFHNMHASGVISIIIFLYCTKHMVQYRRRRA